MHQLFDSSRAGLLALAFPDNRKLHGSQEKRTDRIKAGLLLSWISFLNFARHSSTSVHTQDLALINRQEQKHKIRKCQGTEKNVYYI